LKEKKVGIPRKTVFSSSKLTFIGRSSALKNSAHYYFSKGNIALCVQGTFPSSGSSRSETIAGKKIDLKLAFHIQA